MSASGIRPAWQLPLQWPPVPGRSLLHELHRLRRERVVKAGIVVALVTLTVLDRFGLRLGELYSAHPALLAMYGLVLVMLSTGGAELNIRGVVNYVAVASIAGLSFLLNANVGSSQYASITSWVLLMVLYAPFMVSFREGAVSPSLRLWAANLYLGFALFIAIAGIAQFFAQFVFRPPWLFDYMLLIPAPIRAFEVWHSVNPVGDWTKSNGFFLREPSFFSLQMAFALLCELSLTRRRWVIAILGLGLALSYSGSGLLVLAIGLLFPLDRYAIMRFAAAGAAAAAMFYFFGDTLNLSYTVDRVDEFRSSNTSAYCRFIDPLTVTLQQLDADPWTSMLGHGPGTLYKQGEACSETTLGKVPFEYGLLGTLALTLLVVGVLSRPAVPLRIRAALCAQWVTQPFLLAPEWMLTTYMLCAVWPAEGGTGTRAASERPE